MSSSAAEFSTDNQTKVIEMRDRQGASLPFLRVSFIKQVTQYYTQIEAIYNCNYGSGFHYQVFRVKMKKSLKYLFCKR